MEQATLIAPVTPAETTQFGPVLPAATSIWRFEVIGRPEPKGSWKAFNSNSTGRAMAVPSNKAPLERWEKLVAETAQACRPSWLREPWDGPVAMTCVFVRERGDDYLADGRTLRKGARRFPDTAPDGDKLARAVADALEGIAYTNDGRIVVGPFPIKRYAELGEREKVEVEVGLIE